MRQEGIHRRLGRHALLLRSRRCLEQNNNILKSKVTHHRGSYRFTQVPAGLTVSLSKKLSGRAKTYNSGDSLVVTHLTTNPPVQCLTRAERTGSRDLIVLWSYVKEWAVDWLLVLGILCLSSILSLTIDEIPGITHVIVFRPC
jgi:hypothetical protein